MSRIPFFSPEAKAKRIIQKRLSQHARNELGSKIPLIIIVAFAIFLAIPTYIKHLLTTSYPSIASKYGSIAAAIFLILLDIIFIVAYIVDIVKHIKAIYADAAGWVQYQHLITDGTAKLNGSLHAVEVKLRDYNYNISLIEQEQQQLIKEYAEKFSQLEKQVAAEKQAIADEELEMRKFLLEQIIALRKQSR